VETIEAGRTKTTLNLYRKQAEHLDHHSEWPLRSLALHPANALTTIALGRRTQIDEAPAKLRLRIRNLRILA
jgi:hypothetical protein